MNKALITSVATAFSLLVSVNVAAQPECKVLADEEKPNQYSVINSSGEKLGYIALEPDGSWFAWVKNKGALNDTFINQEDAKEKVCSLGK